MFTRSSFSNDRNIKIKICNFIIGLVFIHSIYGDDVLKSGEKVIFLGDSITAQGWERPHGYVRLVVEGLKLSGIKIQPIPAGIGGNTSLDILARLKRDVLNKNADWVLILCGMNDVIHGSKGIEIDLFKANMSNIVKKCEAANIKVALLTPTTYGDAKNENAKKLERYSAYLRLLAKEKKCKLIDLNQVFSKTVKKVKPMFALTGDGVHMTSEGNILLAKTILKSFNITDQQIIDSYQKWLDIPHAGDISARVDIVLNKQYFSVKSTLTLRQREKLINIAQEANKPTLMHWAKDFLHSLIKKKVKPLGEFNSLSDLFEAKNKKNIQTELQEEFNREIQKMTGQTGNVE